jgi:hypothetical protein
MIIIKKKKDAIYHNEGSFIMYKGDFLQHVSVQKYSTYIKITRNS